MMIDFSLQIPILQLYIKFYGIKLVHIIYIMYICTIKPENDRNDSKDVGTSKENILNYKLKRNKL